jgi:NAD(P)-dependent dehydrogenase (short-subunit alcohol dehydrogenase family)
MPTAAPLQGKRVLVTGPTAGIGRQIALELAASGSRAWTASSERHDALVDDTQHGVLVEIDDDRQVLDPTRPVIAHAGP